MTGNLYRDTSPSGEPQGLLVWKIFIAGRGMVVVGTEYWYKESEGHQLEGSESKGLVVL